MKRILPSSLIASCALLIAAGNARAQLDIRLNDDATARLQENPAIAADSAGNLIVTWCDRRGGTPNPQIYLSRSTDGGFTWSQNLRVSSQQARPAGGMEMGPGIAVAGGAVHINWADIRRTPAWSYVDICHARSTDGGGSFSGDPRINNDTMKMQHQPSLAAGADGTIYSVWHGFPTGGQTTPTPIFIARSTDGGATYGTQRRVDFYGGAPKNVTLGSCNCCRPWVMADGAANVYVAFRIDSANIRDISLARSTDRGETWSPAVRVSHGLWNYNACPGSGPTGAARNDTLFVAWMDQRNALEAPSVYIRRSIDGGRTFGAEIRLDSNANFPSVAFDRAGRVFVTWGTIDEKGEIFCSMSSDGGVTFGPRRRVSGGTPQHMNTGSSSTAAPNGQVYAVWQDTRRDDGDIHFSNLTALMTAPASASPEGPVARAGSSPSVRAYPSPLRAGGELVVELRGRPASASVVDALGRVRWRLDAGRERQGVTIPEGGVFFIVADFDGKRSSTPIIVAR